jgi:hypothetical protein
MSMNTVKKQAEYLAKQNRESDPDITDIYWFPDEKEVRLVEVSEAVPQFASDEVIQPFYFRPAPTDNLPLPSGIALIHSNEVGKLRPPPNWGDWKSAVKIPA